MIRRPPRSTQSRSSAASDVYKRQGQIDPKVVSARQSLPAFLPIVLPAAVMLLPLVDMTLAVFRRLRAGHSPFHADRMHLHHRLLALGHSHRRAVAIMYVLSLIH